ncbi:DUF3817 domain-containing protein [Macrococcus hajekii]|uniref:DUF3817 domain-containing protein n=1 Tax=Macrococcus hajekii TaxID=198482 RepID=A0A4R6BJ41_9STAP|nr:DUF3817 domain-containing protein [Macrococcus hajekii]TDM01521.1 DUF3817 domain-containing protein [Macrococcus hajekii]GGB00667.1 putative membrane protein YdzA [Macrococcus hajekii]
MQNATLNSLFRFFGYLEGLSLLILFFIAMPLKYMAGKPEVVTVFGMIHGALFTLYILMVIWMTIRMKWRPTWLVASIIVAFLPFGTFVFDHYYKRSLYYLS